MQKKRKNWDFLVVFVYDIVNPYCITSLTVSIMVPTSWFPAFFVELGIYSLSLTLIFAIIGPWIPIWANMLGVCTLTSILYLWYSCMYPAKVEKKHQGIFHAKDSAMLTADAVVRRTALQLGKKCLAFGVCDLACDTAALHGYVMGM